MIDLFLIDSFNYIKSLDFVVLYLIAFIWLCVFRWINMDWFKDDDSDPVLNGLYFILSIIPVANLVVGSLMFVVFIIQSLYYVYDLPCKIKEKFKL